MARVLVADDNALSLEFFRESLNAGGHTCEVADDGHAAVRLAETAHFDVLLIDVRMPGQTGPEVLTAIRTGRGPCRNTPALATTAQPSVDRAALLDAGFAEVLVKPISISSLHTLVDRHAPICGVAAPRMAVLDDDIARKTTGGDSTIIAALRSLFATELDVLSDEMERYAAGKDFPALLDRLHRLDASAGFCGASDLLQSAKNLRHQLDLDGAWPENAIKALLAAAARTRDALS